MLLGLVFFFNHQTVIALEFGQPLVSRVNPAVMLKSLADGVHLRQYPSKADVIPRRMNTVTAPTGNGLRVLPSVGDLFDQFTTLSLSYLLDLLGHRALPTSEVPQRLTDEVIVNGQG